MTWVKMCGLMTEEDVQHCAAAGVEAVGLVVEYPLPVPWNLSREEARTLLAAVPSEVEGWVVTGGEVEKIMAVARAVRPAVVQLHYQETLADVRELAERLNRIGIRTVKALRIDSEGRCAFEITDPIRAVEALAETMLSAVVIDSYTAVRPGGTGVELDLSVVQSIRRQSRLPLIVAGGLNPDNVGRVIAEIRPLAVDVLTGVEALPGKKDPEKIRQFMASVQKAAMPRG